MDPTTAVIIGLVLVLVIIVAIVAVSRGGGSASPSAVIVREILRRFGIEGKEADRAEYGLALLFLLLLALAFVLGWLKIDRTSPL